MGVDLTAIPTIGPGTALVIAGRRSARTSPPSPPPMALLLLKHLRLAPVEPGSKRRFKNLPGKSPKAVNPVGHRKPAHGGH